MIYLIGNREARTIKIGFTEGSEQKNAIARLDSMQTGNCAKLELLHTDIIGDRKREQELHEVFSPFRKRGEWFYCNWDNYRVWEEFFNFNFESWIKQEIDRDNPYPTHLIITTMNLFPEKTLEECIKFLRENMQERLNKRKDIEYKRHLIDGSK